MIVLLRAFNWKSLALIFLWSWYYLGSQAVSREYGHIQSSREIKRAVLYGSTSAPSLFASQDNITSTAIVNIDTPFNAAFFNPPQGHDIYGAPLTPFIPDLPEQEAYDRQSWSSPDMNGWYTIQNADEPLVYASKIGSFVYIVGPDGDYTDVWLGSYKLSTSYVYTSCSLEYGSLADFPSDVDPSYFLAFNVSASPSVPGVPQIDMWFRNSHNVIHSVCQIYEHFVDLQGNCADSGCAVRKVRQTPGTNLTTPFSMFTDASLLSQFLYYFQFADGEPIIQKYRSVSNVYGLSGIPDFYFDDNGSPIWNMTGWNDTNLKASLSMTTSLLVSTYLYASQNSEIDFPDDEASRELLLQMAEGYNLGDTYKRAFGTGAFYEPQYHLSIHWLMIDMLTCIILFIVAVFSFWLRSRMVAPDIFGYVSSMTRDNPHLILPDGGSTMSGIDRARALKDVRVKLTDLHANSDVGRIRLTVADSERRVHLNKSKHYV